MHSLRRSQRVVVWIATLALVGQPHWSLATEPTTAPTTRRAVKGVADVALDPTGRFVGQAADVSGKPLSQVDVLITNGRDEYQTVTDRQGRFQVAGVRGGVYQIHLAGHVQLCRVWMPGTAPPGATEGLLVVRSGDIALGQSCDCGQGVYCGSPVCGAKSRAKRLLTHPLVFGGLVAAAIAIPVAIHNDDDPSS